MPTPKPLFGVKSFHANRAVYQQTTYMTGLGKTMPGLMLNAYLPLVFFIPLLHFSVVYLPNTWAIMTPRCSPHINEPFCCRLQPWAQEWCFAGLEKASPPEPPWGCAWVAWQAPSSPGSVLHNLACLQPSHGTVQSFITLIWGQILWELLGWWFSPLQPCSFYCEFINLAGNFLVRRANL